MLKRFIKYFFGKGSFKIWRCSYCNQLITEMQLQKVHSCSCGSLSMRDCKELIKKEQVKLLWRVTLKGY